ncbi:MAG: zf-HC2 domain-containing protein [Planctomycetes bacterium]|nr:zf-HC2 domain-containing protein [Planctomycetota bacterium]
MATSPDTNSMPGQDPCLPIQVDLSAMLDGELDPASVRRVMVHSDVCENCRAFLDGIRTQVRLHKRLAAAGATTLSAAAEGSGAEGSGAEGSGAEGSGAADRLREQLTRNRRRLSRILYELGRCFVLMGLSPDFSREVAKEPVPVPDMAMRGRNLLDEVARSEGAIGPEWVTAKDLFDGHLRSPDENLAKGQRLLAECLALEPSMHEARIYIGLVHYVRGQRALSRQQFATVLSDSEDRILRGYALLNLGNLHLDEGDCDGAVELLLQLVDSGVAQEQPRMTPTAFFNLGLAYGLKGQFRDCAHWFGRLHEETPHRRAWAARELGRRTHFLHLIRSNPDAKVVAESFPAWFAPAQGEQGWGLVGGPADGR